MPTPAPARVAHRYLTAKALISVNMRLTIPDVPTTRPGGSASSSREALITVTISTASGSDSDTAHVRAYSAPGGQQRGTSEITAPEGFTFDPATLRKHLRSTTGISLPRGAHITPGSTIPFTLTSNDPHDLADGDNPHVYLHHPIALPPQPGEQVGRAEQFRGRKTQQAADALGMTVEDYHHWWMNVPPREWFLHMTALGWDITFFWQHMNQHLDLATDGSDLTW